MAHGGEKVQSVVYFSVHGSSRLSTVVRVRNKFEKVHTIFVLLMSIRQIFLKCMNGKVAMQE